MSNYPYFVGVDIETTGLNHKTDQIIEFGATIMDHNFSIIDEFSSFCNPGFKLSPKITAVNNISNDMIKYSDRPNIILTNLTNWIERRTSGNSILVFHNAKFDVKFILELAKNYKMSIDNYLILDTLTLTRDLKYYKNSKDYKLTTLCEYIGYTPKTAHRALDDAKSALYVANHAINSIKADLNIQNHEDVLKLLKSKKLSEYIK